MLRKKCRGLQDADYNFRQIEWALQGNLDDANIRSLSADRIEAGEISAGVIFAGELNGATGKFSGDVEIGGSLVVGEHGVMSIFQYASTGRIDGWGEMGIAQIGGDISVKKVPVNVFVPTNITVVRATIRIESMPVYFYDSIGTDSVWKQGRNLKLYLTDGLEGHMFWVKDSGVLDPYWRTGTDITQVVLPVSSVWSPTLAYDGDDYNTGIEQNKVQVIQGNLINYITTGKLLVFYVETTDLPTTGNFDVNQAMGRILVTIEGYATI